MGHEMAHYVMDHVNDRIAANLVAIDKLEKRLKKEAKKSDYGLMEKLESAVKDITYNTSRYSRSYEVSADSLGLQYIMPSKYSSEEALRALAILDEIDGEKYKDTLQYQEVFTSIEYPFKDYWLKEASGGLVGGNYDNDDGENWESDSLKTHPDCKDRIELIRDRTKPVGEKNLQEAKRFQEIVNQADFEIIQSEYESGDVGQSLFYALQLLDKHPENAYLRTMISKNLTVVYKAQADHQLSKIVGFPNSRQNHNYRQLLIVIRNLRLKDIKRINYNFLQKDKEKFSSNLPYLKAMKSAATLMEKNEEISEIEKQIELIKSNIK